VQEEKKQKKGSTITTVWLSSYVIPHVFLQINWGELVCLVCLLGLMVLPVEENGSSMKETLSEIFDPRFFRQSITAIGPR
jgi:hypothetical protein